MESEFQIFSESWKAQISDMKVKVVSPGVQLWLSVYWQPLTVLNFILSSNYVSKPPTFRFRLLFILYSEEMLIQIGAMDT